jgi:hypothetical protein
VRYTLDALRIIGASGGLAWLEHTCSTVSMYPLAKETEAGQEEFCHRIARFAAKSSSLQKHLLLHTSLPQKCETSHHFH